MIKIHNLFDNVLYLRLFVCHNKNKINNQKKIN